MASFDRPALVPVTCSIRTGRTDSHPHCRFRATPCGVDRLGIMNCKHGSTARVLNDDGGTITVEYAVLLSLVSVGCAFATVALGVPLVKLFVAQELWMALAIP